MGSLDCTQEEHACAGSFPKQSRAGKLKPRRWPTGLPQLLQCVCQPELGEHSSPACLTSQFHSGMGAAMTKEDLSCETPRQLKHEAAPEQDGGRHCSQTGQTPDGSQTTTACTPALTKCLGQPPRVRVSVLGGKECTLEGSRASLEAQPSEILLQQPGG